MLKLFNSLNKFKDKVALVDHSGEIYSYSQIDERAKFIASKVDEQSIILIIASNNVNCIIGYVSFLRSKNLSILLDKSFKTEFAKKIIKKYKPNYIFCPINYKIEFEKKYQFEKIYDYFLIKTDFRKNRKINKKNYLLLSTSGTTQNPKFVRLSNSNLKNNTKNIIKYLNIDSSHTTITTMPMGYSYGLSIINSHLAAGAKIIVNNSTIFERKFWDKLKYHKVTSFGGVPQFYEQMRKIKFENFKLPYLKYLTQAGGKLEKEFLKYYGETCKSKRIKFIIMYGQTEASPRMSYLKWEEFSLKSGIIGKPLNGSQFKILNKNGKYITKPFVIGELVYFGKNVSLGYSLSIKDLNKGNENKGKLFTGDLGYKDNEGFYYITGRKNRISKIFGTRIDLDDIEKFFKKNGYKIKCIPDNKYLKIIVTNNYNIHKIKKIIFNYYGIKENFIFISKVKKFGIINSFKDVIK